MDTLAIVTTYEVLTAGSIRGAARKLNRAPASVSASIARVESELATKLIEKAGSQLAVTLEGRRLLPDFELAAVACLKLTERSITWRGKARNNPSFSVSLLALSRFAQIAKSGSIRRASRDLEVGQPQLSKQMSVLEADMGEKLLERTVDGTLLTVRGGDVLVISEELDEIWKRLTRLAHKRFKKSISTCRLGTIVPVGYESETAVRLADLTAKWLRAHPQSPLFISSTTADELIKGLKSGLYDLALLDTTAVPVDLETKKLAGSKLAVVGSEDLFKSPNLDVKALLKSHPIAVSSPRSGLRQKFTEYLNTSFSQAETDNLTLVDVDSLPIVVNLVLKHKFLAILPKSSFDRMKVKLGYVALGEEYEHTLNLVWSANISSSRMAKKIIELF